MDKLGLQVEYVYHSCYSVESSKYQLIFDYFKGNISIKDKDVVVFASHSHPDHYSEEIFRWSLGKDNIQYVLSDDINLESNGKIRMVAPYEPHQVNGLMVSTLSSTDMGVSFLVEMEGVNIFFAGDLHWWYWDDDTLEEKMRMEKSFKEEISRLKGLRIDIAFFPVDPRLQDHFHEGGKYFIQELSPKYFFPLHFGDNYEIIKDFINIVNSKTTQIIPIGNRNQVTDV